MLTLASYTSAFSKLAACQQPPSESNTPTIDKCLKQPHFCPFHFEAHQTVSCSPVRRPDRGPCTHSTCKAHQKGTVYPAESLGWICQRTRQRSTQKPAGLAQAEAKYSLLLRSFLFLYLHTCNTLHKLFDQQRGEDMRITAEHLTAVWRGPSNKYSFLSSKPNITIKATWTEVDPRLSWFDPSLLLHQSGCWKTRDAKQTYIQALTQIAMTTQTKQHKAVPTRHWILNAL